MNKEAQIIADNLNQLIKLQAGHIESFEKKLMPDLETQLAKRKKEFDKLKTTISRFIAQNEIVKDADTESMIIFFIDRINILMSQNKMLTRKVKIHKNGLRKSLTKISKGKKVMNSYGKLSPILNKPRAINVTN